MSRCCYMCVLRHQRVSSYCYISSVLILYVSSYCYISSVRILLYILPELLCMCHQASTPRSRCTRKRRERQPTLRSTGPFPLARPSFSRYGALMQLVFSLCKVAHYEFSYVTRHNRACQETCVFLRHVKESSFIDVLRDVLVH